MTRFQRQICLYGKDNVGQQIHDMKASKGLTPPTFALSLVVARRKKID